MEGRKDLNSIKNNGMPTCEGVALGVDRLLVLITGRDIKAVMPFHTENLICLHRT
ncbi:MAG: hypothetical protein LWW94_05455 [Candidatus Desulfofervidaceae bacterium]|nr:hypothetical protein [Candidatus Desulfofervidaceae bacterium]